MSEKEKEIQRRIRAYKQVRNKVRENGIRSLTEEERKVFKSQGEYNGK